MMALFLRFGDGFACNMGSRRAVMTRPTSGACTLPSRFMTSHGQLQYPVDCHPFSDYQPHQTPSTLGLTFWSRALNRKSMPRTVSTCRLTTSKSPLHFLGLLAHFSPVALSGSEEPNPCFVFTCFYRANRFEKPHKAGRNTVLKPRKQKTDAHHTHSAYQRTHSLHKQAQKCVSPPSPPSRHFSPPSTQHPRPPQHHSFKPPRQRPSTSRTARASTAPRTPCLRSKRSSRP